jgi:XTP/dITP diphosphohydrolase
MREILLATGNPGKAKEMREILSGRDHGQIRWRHLSEFADRHWPEPIENGETFLANAEIKACHYAQLSGMWTIADDSGLVVDALGGEPGVRSARYAGEPKSDAANNALLIRKLAGVPEEQRTARFCCALVLAGWRSPSERRGSPPPSFPSPGDVQLLASAEGTVEGRMIDEPRGTNGFGYDPHFWVPQFAMTTAEMAPDQKHAISHRGQALRLLRDKLAELIV